MSAFFLPGYETVYCCIELCWKIFLHYFFLFLKCTFIKQYIQDVKLGLWILPECSILHHFPIPLAVVTTLLAQWINPLRLLNVFLAPNFFILGANWILDQKSYFEAWHYVIKYVSDLQQISGFLWILRFPPPIKLFHFPRNYLY